MSAFAAVVRLFLRDLVRRRLFWILAFVTLGGAALNYWAARSIDQAVGQGATWEVATRRAVSGLDEVATTLRAWASFFVVIVAAQVAPESRRNGTTQFVLTTGVRRDTLAAAQFVALGVLLATATLVIHIAFVVAGARTGTLTARDVWLAWPLFFVPMAAVAASVLAFSLTASAIETCFVFIGVPLLTAILPRLMQGLPGGLPMGIVRAMDNITLFFPSMGDVVPWPHATFAGSERSAPSSLAMCVVHMVFACAFWVVLGLYRHRRHDFGSRTAVK